MTATPESSGRFGILGDLWPALRELGEQAERLAGTEPTFAAIRLRGLGELMAEQLQDKIGIPRGTCSTHFERLQLLQQENLLDSVLLAKFHTIRLLGNKAAHNGVITHVQANNLLVDAASLTAWFCRFMRPDLGWLTADQRPSEIDAASKLRQSTDAGQTGKVVKFPEDRIHRLREDVARAMAEVDPSVRQLRTRMTIQEAFGDELTTDQRGCIAALESFLGNQDERVFLLKGYAGTGKTFLAKGLTEFLLSQGRSFHLAAPTGRAAKVISEKTQQRATTLHSLVYNFDQLMEYAEGDELDGSETYKMFADIEANSGQANTVYIVDEASMISDDYSESEFFRSGTGYLLKDFFKFVEPHNTTYDRKIIFLGDPAQLPPVGMQFSPALDSEYIRKNFGFSCAEYELKEVVRQKAESSIIRNIMPLRDGLAGNSFGGLSFHFDQDVIRTRPDEIAGLYVALREAHGPDAPLVITASNSEAASVNRAIRSRLFAEREFVTAGDRLIVTRNAYIGDRFLANGELVRVDDVESRVEQRWVTLKIKNPAIGKVEAQDVALTFRNIRLSVLLSDGAEAVLDAKILDDQLHDDEAGLISAQQRALYVDFCKRHPDLRSERDRGMFVSTLRMDPYFNALRVKFGYAVTCHKAQGGEWSHVIVSCPTNRDPRNSDYFRWLYTAMTRARGKLYLLNPPEVRIKLAGPSLDMSVPSSAVPTAPSLSSHEAFRQGLLSDVRAIVERAGIELEDVAHHQYQEAFYLRHGPEKIRVNITYNAKLMITGINPTITNAIGEELGRLLAPLIGRYPTRAPPGGGATPPAAAPSQPFLRTFHERLLPPLDAKQIRVVSLKEQQWSQRYTFARDTETATVDIFFNGRQQITKCSPVLSGGSFGRAPGPLLREVIELISDLVL